MQSVTENRDREGQPGYRSVADMFLKRVASTPDSMAFQFPRGESDWSSMTWGQVEVEVRGLACGLLSLGLELEERVAILCSTRVEWILADLAVMCAGGTTTTIYPNNTAEECQFIISDSGARFAFAETEAHVARLLEQKPAMSGLQNVIVIDGEGGHDGWVMTLDDLVALGKRFESEHPNQLRARAQSIEPHHLATLIYTSGTTGRPKGVELLHDCWVFEGEAIARTGLLEPNDHQYLWLPLSHSFGKVLEVAQLQIGFSTTVDGRIPKLVDNLAVIRPTVMAAAPRIFEKIHARIVSGAIEAGGLKLKVFRWAMNVGRQVSCLRQEGEQPGLLLGLQYRLATQLVFSKLQGRFGGRLRFFLSGSAPLSVEVNEFFHAAGILILEGYGLTESSAATFVGRLDSFRIGTVGPPVDGIEVRLDADDGEILIRGRGIMRGYHNLPEATAETLDADGWLHTGDIGELDAKGRLRITDRKKNLIKTSGGKYVAPQKLESRLKAICPYISHVIVHGDGRNFCTALITLDEESTPQWAEDHGIGRKSVAVLAKEKAVRDMVQAGVDELNSTLATYETIKKFAILPADLSEATGELTASLKVRRKVVEEKYADILDGFYVVRLR